jgi:hypothetical protein
MLLNRDKSSFSVSSTKARNSEQHRVSMPACQIPQRLRAHHYKICARSRPSRLPSSRRPGGDRHFSGLRLLSKYVCRPMRRCIRWSSLRRPFFSAGRSRWPCLRVSSVAHSSATLSSATLALGVAMVVVLSAVYHGRGSRDAEGRTGEVARELLVNE